MEKWDRMIDPVSHSYIGTEVFEDNKGKYQNKVTVTQEHCSCHPETCCHFDGMRDINKTEKIYLDPIVEGVVSEIRKRSRIGIEKYGTTLEENNTDDFLQHLKEELMDAVNYIQKIQSDKNKKN